jgi:hypothetical protein
MISVSLINLADPRIKKNVEYATPIQLDNSITNTQIDSFFYTGNPYKYTIRGNFIKVNIIPSADDVLTWGLRVNYFQRVPPLVPPVHDDPSILDSNWMSELNPDTYIFGLLAEINAFLKDANSTALWDARFKETLDEIEIQDSQYTWSGGPIITRVV